VPPHGHVGLRASLARLRLECLGPGQALQLLGEGRGREALAACDRRELPQPWVFIYVRRGRVTRFHLAQKFAD
jgi:hypothetical protein